MFCYIQEVGFKRDIGCATSKRIEVTELKWSINSESKIRYGWRYSDDKFDRPVRKAYKISIQESYRDKDIKNGSNIKKKQFHICYMSYYDFVDYSFYDCHHEKMIEYLAEQLNTTSDALYDLIYAKIDPLQKQIDDEFNALEEGIEKLRQQEIIRKYQKNKFEFAKKYDVDEKEYDYCYDVFGELRNENYLKKVRLDFQFKKEYEKKSQEESRRYYKQSYSNYSNNQSASIGVDEGNKDIYKQFYRMLSKKFHPDANPDKDTSEEMKLINQLKSQWGV